MTKKKKRKGKEEDEEGSHREVLFGLFTPLFLKKGKNMRQK
jgi:hypothetical protein